MQTLFGEWTVRGWETSRTMVRNLLFSSAGGPWIILHLKHSAGSRESHTEDVLLGWREKKRKGESAARFLPASCHARMINCRPARAV